MFLASHSIRPRTAIHVNQRPQMISAILQAFNLSSSSSKPASPYQNFMAQSARPYSPRHVDFPYSAMDMHPMDPSPDTSFYRTPRFVTHIDDNAIRLLREYYKEHLPTKGRILDFCSSWISHYPDEMDGLVKSGDVEVLGLGMNAEELKGNPLFGAHSTRWGIVNLNENPEVKLPGDLPEKSLDAATCTVSIDYLTKPVDVLKSLRGSMKEGATVHLAISNRCFPTKVVGRWLRISEEERLEMVGDYLHFGGWKDVEIVTLSEGRRGVDPLWVVRGKAS